MIVPGFVVKRIYKKGGLKNEGDYFYFTFVNAIAKSDVSLVGPATLGAKSPIGTVELESLPTLVVDEKEISVEDITMLLNGQELPPFEEATVGQTYTLEKGSEITTKVKGNIDDGKHNFSVTFRAKQFGSITLKFTDAIGVAEEVTLWQRIINFFKRIFGMSVEEKEIEEKPKLEPDLTILKGVKHDTNFERLRTALTCGQPDRVPLCELNIDERVKTAFMGKIIEDMKGEVEFWISAGYDYMPLWTVTLIDRAMQITKFEYNVYDKEAQERGWMIEGKGNITSMEEFERFQWPRAEDALFMLFEEAEKVVPPEMKVIANISGIFELTSQCMGLETFSISMIENPELVKAMTDKIGNLQVEIVKRALEFDCVGAIWIGDDIAYSTSLLVSPEHLRQYIFPWHKRMAEVAKTKNLPVLYHSDGDLTKVMGDLLDCGINALHPIEPKALDIKEMKKKYQGRLCLIGNIDLIYTLTRGTPEEVEAEVKQIIKEVAPGGGYCVSSANSVTDYVPLENFKRMNETCLKYGKYPIQL